MPAASAGAAKKYMWLDHDPPHIDISPPVINVWNEVYHDYDVRQSLMAVKYRDDEETGAQIEVRWTIDGQIYVCTLDADDGTQYYIYKTKYSQIKTEPLDVDTSLGIGIPYYRDKRGQDFLVEVRIITAVGTNAHLEAWALYETLEAT